MQSSPLLSSRPPLPVKAIYRPSPSVDDQTPNSMAAAGPKLVQKTITLPPYSRGCHLITSKIASMENTLKASVKNTDALREELTKLMQIINTGKISLPVIAQTSEEQTQQPICTHQTRCMVRFPESPNTTDPITSLTKFGKVDFPSYDGIENFRGWLYKCNCFFKAPNVPDEQKAEIASMYLSGAAIIWHECYMEDNKTFPNWRDYIFYMSLRFGEGEMQDPIILWKNLSQPGSVNEYQKDFERIRVRVKCSEKQAVFMFVGGPKEELQHSVTCYNPKSIVEAYAIAKHQELSVNSIIEKSRNLPPLLPLPPNSQKTFPNIYPYIYQNQNTKLPYNLPKPPAFTPQNSHIISSVAKDKPRNTRSLSEAKLEDRKQKGLCFWCDERHTAGHRCSKKKLYDLEIYPVDEEGAVEVENLDEQMSLNQITVSDKTKPVVSIHSLDARTTYNVFKVIGSVNNKPILILVDSRSTHNILNEELVAEFGLETTKTESHQIFMADGIHEAGTRKCERFKWMMQGYQFETEMLLSPLKDYDLILGVQWLEPFEKHMFEKFEEGKLLETSPKKGQCAEAAFSLEQALFQDKWVGAGAWIVKQVLKELVRQNADSTSSFGTLLDNEYQCFPGMNLGKWFSWLVFMST
ncbi:hypothetical protein SLEP1_g41856 [Rubroshorea leprosula]|uniref:Retrotransposon gag domain-containing protein n=1 Tax=Rubroshorea leprosula TaxID=152421 RepID=A0AAV5L8C2_9ROSI|nr:hypothetical protein SLEP1_g41856 [Rubroshorea leprosula]